MKKKPKRKGLPPSKAASSPKRKKASQVKSSSKNKGSKPSTASPSSPQENIPPSPLKLLFPEGIETLLEVEGRKQLPQFSQGKPGRKNKLYELIKFAPDLYAKMIQQLAAGVSPNVAAECCGIAERTFFEWGELGARDANNIDEETGELDPIDSYYSRFYMDVRRAVATKAAECEAKLAEVDPIKWLSRGSGRIFGGKWGKNPDKPTPSIPLRGQQALPAPEEDAIEGTFTVKPQLTSQGQPSHDSSTQSGIDTPSSNSPTDSLPSPSPNQNHSVLPISPETEFEALKVLEGIGQIQISEALRQAYEDQASDNDDNDTDTDNSDDSVLEGEVE